jgi:RHS repeat-associated protein
MDLDFSGTIEQDEYDRCQSGTGIAALDAGAISDPDFDSGPWSCAGYDGSIYDDIADLLCVRFRWYNAGLGRWMTRDPAGYVDGAHIYAYAQSSPVAGLDHLGLWRDKGNHIWEAEDGDTLRDLARRYDTTGVNWPCLWPTENTQDHGYPETVRKCDTYDASNLAVPSPTASGLMLSIDSSYYGRDAAFYGTKELIHGSRVASRIKQVSGEGATPIEWLVIAGHSSGPRMSGRKSGYDDPYGSFATLSLVDLASEPVTFERASSRRGPIRCWFTRDASVYFAGCNSGTPQPFVDQDVGPVPIAQSFANRVLRVGATAYGAGYYIQNSKTHVSWYETKRGPRVGRSDNPYDNASWVAYKGRL